MANYFGTGINEGQSTTRPPLFTGSDYSYWKARMRTFLQANDYESWNVIVKGPHVITKTVRRKVVPKPEDEWNANDIKLVQINARAMHFLYCALDVNEFNKISSCDSAKEVWDKLEISNEGTTQVKEDKISMLVHEYELFKMEPSESISSMHDRFVTITNSLNTLGKIYSNEDILRKILRTLPKKWRPKVTAIQEAKDLKILSLDELLGSLKTHEQELERQEGEHVKPKKNLALKVLKQESDDEEDGEIDFITTKFMKFLTRKKSFSKWKSKGHASDNRGFESG